MKWHPPLWAWLVAGSLSHAACAETESTAAPPTVARSTPALRVVRDPGPPPHEAPPRSTLWRNGPDGWQLEGRVRAVSPDGRARVDVNGVLMVDGQRVSDGVVAPLAVGPDGAVVFVRQPQPPERDLWRVTAGRVERLTHDGTSDRPVFTPDGRLLWIASVEGRARWVLDGRPLSGSAATAPPPAFAEGLRWVGSRLHYDAGDRRWWLDPTTGEAGPR